MSELILSEANSGATVTARMFDILVIRLPEHATTGYRWEMSMEPPEFAHLTDDKTIPPGARPGEGTTRTFRLEPLKPGTGTLRFRYRRSFDPAGTASHEVAFSLNIAT